LSTAKCHGLPLALLYARRSPPANSLRRDGYRRAHSTREDAHSRRFRRPRCRRPVADVDARRRSISAVPTLPMLAAVRSRQCVGCLSHGCGAMDLTSDQNRSRRGSREIRPAFGRCTPDSWPEASDQPAPNVGIALDRRYICANHARLRRCVSLFES